MKMTVDAGMMKEVFASCGRDYYSYSGLETLLDYYDEIDENMEFDPIAICCDCSEFGNEYCELSFNDLINDYGYLYPVAEWLDDNALNENEFDADLYVDSLIECLEDKTTLLHVSNGNVIIFSF